MTATEPGENLSYAEVVEPQWQGEWQERYSELAVAAGLSETQKACYQWHLCGLTSVKIACKLFGDPGPCPLATAKRERKSWFRRVSLARIRVDCAVVQAEERIAKQFPHYGLAGGEFKRNLLVCFTNRPQDWATIPFTQTRPDVPQRCPSARVLDAADLGRASRAQALRLFTQNLAADVERGSLNPIV